ncbi:MAG: hypothetical protein KAI74_07435 [Kiritimatiellae bacterium]|nr:hypothetical protein [Kiritimatiellia bacterium]
MKTEKNTIQGIYHYCDRWCERCSFTSRCANFSFSEEHFSTPEERDINNEKFWQKLHEVFQLTMEMVIKESAKHGIDINDLDLEDAEESEKKKREEVNATDCVQAAKKYSETAGDWLTSNNNLFEQKQEHLLLQVRLELPNNTPEEEASDIIDAVEVIQWYQFQIYVKLARAVGSKTEEDQEKPDDYPKDSDGSAKVVLVALDRSIASWATIRNHFSEQEDCILDILINLSRLRTSVEETFPDARSFIRPGLDNSA